MNWNWDYVAKYIVEDIYGGYVDWDEQFFECPECGEPIYREDYPSFSQSIICPVCETSSDNIE